MLHDGWFQYDGTSGKCFFFSELFCRQVIKSRYRKWNMLMSPKGKTQQKLPPAAWWEQLVVFSRGRVEAETLELWYRGGNNKINANHWRVLKVLLSHVQTIQSHSDKSWGTAAELFSFFLFIFYFLIYFYFVMNARKSVFSPLFIAFFQKEGMEARQTQEGGSEAWPQGVASAELQLHNNYYNNYNNYMLLAVASLKKWCRNERSKLKFPLDK